MKRLLFVCFSAWLVSLPVFAHNHKDKCCDDKFCPRPEHAQSASFDMLKSLQGFWKGSHEVDGKKEPVNVRYKVTSGGSAVEETLFPDTPHEMVSIYTLQNGKTEMTHYCMIGNQPRMKEQSFGNGTLVLKFMNTPGINSKKDSYMGELTLTLKDSKRLDHAWTFFEKGTPVHTEAMNFVKQK